MKKIIEFLNSLFFWAFKSRRIEYFDLLDEYEDYVRDVDISEKNTLLCSVRSIEQYETNIEYCFYHIPVQAVEDPDKVQYIALYRSKKLFKDNSSGVLHYGVVNGYEKVMRSQIKEVKMSMNFDSYYYRFNVLEWKTLPFPLKASQKAPVVAYMTNFYLVENSKYVYELYIENNNEYKLYKGLLDIIYQVYDGFFIGGFKVYINFSRIILLSPKGKFFYKVSEYKHKPYETFLKIKEVIFNS